jgi:hypothetical protein
MPGQGRTIGIILIAIAAVVFLIAAILVIAQASTGETTVTGAILGILIVTVVVALPLGAGGVYLLVKGKAGEHRLCGGRKAEEDPEHGAGAGQGESLGGGA